MILLTVIGARPQFVKAAFVHRALVGLEVPRLQHLIIHTGQHFDENMSGTFFREFDLPQPDWNLGVHGGSHGEMTGRMLCLLEPLMQSTRPDMVAVYGDTNSTLAAALVAAKLHLRIAHIEAGLRSFNRRMPEEVNRVVVDHLSDLLLCPSDLAVETLRTEGISRGVRMVGDVMLDAVEHTIRRGLDSIVLGRHGLSAEGYYLVTCHRAENTDDPSRLKRISEAVDGLPGDAPVLFPVHPRTAQAAAAAGIDFSRRVRTVPPLPYEDSIYLQANAIAVLTDSGGMQKEAYFLGVPCITLREETEWQETVTAGWNTLCGADLAAIRLAAERCQLVRKLPRPRLYGDGHAAARVSAFLLEAISA